MKVIKVTGHRSHHRSCHRNRNQTQGRRRQILRITRLLCRAVVFGFALGSLCSCHRVGNVGSAGKLPLHPVALRHIIFYWLAID